MGAALTLSPTLEESKANTSKGARARCKRRLDGAGSLFLKTLRPNG